MLMKWRRPLREAFNVDYSRIRMKSASLENIHEVFHEAITHHRGIAISEEWHGNYAFPLFMRDMMPLLKSWDVGRDYTEMILASKQDIVDDWQKEDIEQRDEDSFPDHLDSQPNHYAYSRFMWAHYWQMFCKARENRIKLIGLDKPEIASGYGAVF
jgi:hypothetical protein